MTEEIAEQNKKAAESKNARTNQARTEAQLMDRFIFVEFAERNIVKSMSLFLTKQGAGG